jgi:hypothetical protein
MQNRDVVPSPKHFPCQIGIDFWVKNYERVNGKKGRKPSNIFYKNSDVQTDIDGWVNPTLWLPLAFDLCWLKTEKRVCTGWWTGKEWEGLRLKKDESILYWKRCTEEMSS